MDLTPRRERGEAPPPWKDATGQVHHTCFEHTPGIVDGLPVWHRYIHGARHYPIANRTGIDMFRCP